MKRITESLQLKIIFVGMILLFVAVIIPLFRIAHYNFTSVDDFTFAANSGRVWKETHSVWRVLVAQTQYAKEMWHNWQRIYFGVWAYTCAMGIFAEDAYYMATYVSLGGFVLAELCGIIVILVKCLGADRIRAGIVAISCLTLQILLCPVPVEAFYCFAVPCLIPFYTIWHGCWWRLC